MRKMRIAAALGIAMLAPAGCGEGPPPPAAPTAPAGVTSPVADDSRVLRAVELLEVERRPADAADAFRTLVADERVPASVRARAKIGLARAERLLGHRDAAEALLREVLAKHSDLAAVCADAQTELASMAGAATRYATGIVDLADAQFLDLDSGGVFGAEEIPLGGRAEIVRRGDRLVYLVPHDEAPEMTGLARSTGDLPWWRVVTDAGRAAWVQRLPAERPALLRFVVRISGVGAPLPAPNAPFCVGTDHGIDVRFAADERFVRYRVERRVGVDGPFESKGEIAGAPYADRDAKAGLRYGYRITGITERGDEGLPATVQGTPASRGVFRGEVDLVGGRGPAWFDFLAEKPVASGGDLALNSSYGGGNSVGFIDGWGRVVTAAPDGVEPRTVWAVFSAGRLDPQIESGRSIIVPLRGGGVARARVRCGNAWRVHLDYEVDPDADEFRDGATIAAEERASDAAVRVVAAPQGFSVAAISVRDPRSDEAPESLVVRAGVAIDAKGGPGSLREYTAEARDAFGRRCSQTPVTLNRLSATPVEGTFELHYQQGYSFDLERVVDVGDADIVFARCAGGISSITLTAPGGIVTLEDLMGRDRDAPSAGRLFDLVLGADETAIRLSGSVHCDDRSSPSDVAVLRTRHGGWARVAIVERHKDAPGDWQKLPATIRFTWNPREPLFASSTETTEVVAGVRLAPGAMPARRPLLRSGVAAAVTAARWAGASPFNGAAGGKVPDSASCQEVLLALRRYDDLDKATYSLLAGARDDLGERRAGGLADLRYGDAGDGLEIRPGVPDGSMIVDLGEKSWDEVATGTELVLQGQHSVVASFGHAYVVFLADGVGGDTAIVRVAALVPGERVAIEWALWRGGRMTTSPGLALPAASADALAKSLERLAASRRGGGIDDDAPMSEAARSTRAKLAATKGVFGLARQPLEAILRGVAAMAGAIEIDPAVRGVAATAEVEFTSQDVVSITEVLDVLTRQARLSWTVDAAGTVRIVPAPK